MKLGTSTIGRMGRPEPKPPHDEIQQRRIAGARGNPKWTELDPVDLVERGNGRFLVSASDDSVFTAYTGAVWNALGGIAHSERNPLYFVVEDGDVQLYERHTQTWSERVRQSVRR